MAMFALATLLATMIPIILDRKMINLTNDKVPVLIALQSEEFKLSLVVSLSVSAPVFFELLLRIVSSAKLEYVLPNVAILMTLAVPDLFILTYIRYTLDLSWWNYVLKARFIVLAWVAFSFIKIHGGNKCSPSGLLFSFVLICAGRALDFYKDYVLKHVCEALSLAQIISDVSAFIVVIIISLKWYHYIIIKLKSTISINEYMCNVYITAFLLTAAGLFVNLYTYPNAIDSFYWNSNQLTTHTLLFTVFYIVVIIFEGRALQREMLQNKVYLFI